MELDVIVDKLKSLGISDEMIANLKEKLGDNMVRDIQTLGFKGALQKAGMDTTNIPDVDLSGLANLGQEMIGKDVDGDGKTGIDEVMEAASNLATATGETMSSALNTVTDAVDGVKNSDMVQSATEKASDAKEAVVDFAQNTGVTGVVSDAVNVVKEATGTDVDGDGKTGFSEAVSQAKEMGGEIKQTAQNIANSEPVATAKEMASNMASNVKEEATGFMAKIKSFFGK